MYGLGLNNPAGMMKENQSSIAAAAVVDLKRNKIKAALFLLP